MKWALAISILLNIIFGAQYYLTPSVGKVSEISGTVIKKKKRKIEVEPIETRGHVVDEMPKKLGKKSRVSTTQNDKDFQYAYEEADEKTQNEKFKYLTDTLEVPQAELDKIEKVKAQYQQELMKVTNSRSMFLPSLAEKKQMIKLEEQRNERISQIMGAKKYQAYIKFIDKYNEELVKQQMSDNGVIIPMDL